MSVKNESSDSPSSLNKNELGLCPTSDTFEEGNHLLIDDIMDIDIGSLGCPRIPKLRAGLSPKEVEWALLF
jgi:hypothetical protein|uniref:Uncharacterized protein n=1 Tax=Picea glauca TaxID=3330 RepID=A0A101M182_PICGL|nr:hypothetical protein ABT39_MTgene4357 [Picea glauca]